MVVPMLVAALIGHIAVADARHRMPKQSLSAVVNGRHLKFGRKLITSTSSAELGSLNVVGIQKPHLGKLVRGLIVGCPNIVAGSVFPADGMFCAVSYNEIKYGRNLPMKSWAGVADAVRVTVTSFDGTRVTGTFDGTLQSFDPSSGDGPYTVSGGAFDIQVTQTP
jgi:hypothetical protein